MADVRRRWLIVGIVAMVGVLVSLLAAWNAQQRQEDAVQADFHADVVQIEDDINEAFTLYQYGLRGARGAVLVPGADNVTREQFATYSASRDVDLEFPGSRGFGFIRKVPMAQEEEFLAAARADDAPDFQIKEIAPNTGDARYVIQYIEPVADNRAAVGLDTASEVRRKAAADQASQTGQVTISDPITLVQAEAEAQQSFLIFLPVYQPGLPLDTPEQRQAATVGWSYTPIVTREVLEDIGVDQQAFAFELSQVKPDGSTEAFYTGPGFAEAAATDVSDTTLMEVFGSEWMLQVRAKPAFLASVNATSPRQVLAVGLIATLLASALTYAYMLARSRRREASAQKEELERGRELGYERQRFENILTGTNAGTWEWNVQTGELRLNDRWAEIVGYTLDELAPTTIETWIKLTHPADLARSEELLAQHFDGDLDFYDLEVRMRHKDGHWVWVHDRGKVASWTPDGRPEWMFGTHMDITRTRELQRALTEAQDVLERGGQLARLGGWRLKVGADPTDLSGTELLWTETTRAIHEVPDGYVPDVTEGIQFYAEEFQPVITAAVHRALTAGEGWDLELQLVTYRGRTIWVRTVGEAEMDENGRVTALYGVFQDIDDRHRIEAELREAKAAADEASAAKSRFLANTSHEIRTPMNALIGLTYLLGQSELDPEQRDLLAKIDFAGTSLAAIINDVLDLSKVEAGELVLEQLPINLGAIVAEVVALMAPQARLRTLDWRCTIGSDTPPVLIGDATRVRQIVANLLSNALKFTEPGGSVTTALELRRTGDGVATMRLSVTDTGIGISAEAQARLFTPFTQADTSTSRTYGGTGLGLSIVRRLTDLMGGEAGFTSEPGQGSEFWVDLPLAMPSEYSGLTNLGALGAVRVMIAERDRDQRQAMVHLARAMGWETDDVDSGSAMIDRTVAMTEQGAPPDVLLLDWRLPDMDALATLATLKERLHGLGLPAAIVLTDHNRDVITAQPNAALADRILTTPVDPSDLFNAVSDAMARSDRRHPDPAGSAGDRPTSVGGLDGRRVLVVDDSELNLLVARRILELHGANVIEESSGAAALATLADDRRIDALLLDVQMPEVDGYEVARRLRHELGLTTLPIIALTAGAMTTEREAALDAGMDAFLTKPLDPALLVATILELTPNAGTGAGSGAAPAEPPTPAGLASKMPDVPGIDNHTVVDVLGDDVELFLELLARLVIENDPDELARTAADAEGRDREQLRQQMHKLRGSAGMLGAHAIHSRAGDAEEICRHGGTDDDLTAALTDAADGIRVIQAHLPGSVEPVASATPPPTAPGGPRPEPSPDLRGLATLLAQRDLAAVDRVEDVSAELQLLLGAEDAQRLRSQVRALEFEGASAMLQQVLAD